jgi:hypothetical protein
VAAALTVNGRQRATLLKSGAAGSSRRHDDAFTELGELQKLAAVQRQAFDVMVVDDVADFSARRIQHRCFGGHGDRVRDLADLQCQRQVDALADQNGHAALRQRSEAGERNRDVVSAVATYRVV